MAGFHNYALAGGAVSRKEGPLMAETDGSGGPLSVGDQIFRDRPAANGRQAV